MSTVKTSKKAGFAGLFAAIAASACCIPPVFALIAGVGGGASAFSWMEPFRPYLIGLAILAIGYAWYNYFNLNKAENCDCEIGEKTKWFQTKNFLIGITLFATLAISFPYYSHVFYPDNRNEIMVVNESDLLTVNYNVQGMTCASCEEHVKHSVNKLDGIVRVDASYENANAEVQFDKTKISKEDIEKAIKSTGYKVIDLKENK